MAAAPAASKGKTNGDSGSLTALRKLNQAIQECLTYEDQLENAKQNQKIANQLRCENAKTLEQLNQAEQALQKLVRAHEDRYTSFTNEKAELSGLNKQLQDKCAKMQSESKKSSESKQRCEEEMKRSKASLNEAIQKLDTTIKESSARETQISSLMQELEQEKGHSGSLTQVCDLLRAKCLDLEKQLRTYTEDLKKWNSYRFGLQPDNIGALQKDISALCRDTHFLALKFKTEPRTRLKNSYSHSELLKELKSFDTLKGLSFIPVTASEGAKDVRMIIAFAVISNLLMEHVFIPTYVNRGHALYERLSVEAAKDPARESLCRALILSLAAGDEVQRPPVDEIVESITQSADKMLGPMLLAEHEEAFEVGLKGLILKAMVLWANIQSSTTRIEASLSKSAHGGWDQIKLSTNTGRQVAEEPTQNTNGNADEVAFVFFPVFYKITEMNHHDVIFRGFAVKQSQLACVEHEAGEPPRIQARASSTRRNATEH